MNPITERIEKELNKTFESVSEKWVKTSSVIKKLNLQLVEQRQSKFNPEIQLTKMKIDEKTVNLTAVNNPEKTELPNNFQLMQNHPNPFNPETTIKFSIAKTEHVQILIYNQLGQKVKTLLNENKTPGVYELNWDGRNEFGEKADLLLNPIDKNLVHPLRIKKKKFGKKNKKNRRKFRKN